MYTISVDCERSIRGDEVVPCRNILVDVISKSSFRDNYS